MDDLRNPVCCVQTAILLDVPGDLLQIRDRGLRPLDAHLSGAFSLLEPRAHLFVGNCFAAASCGHAIADFASKPIVVGYEMIHSLCQQFVGAPVGSPGQFIEPGLRLRSQI